MSETLQYGLQHARLPCPSSSPRACSKLCPLSRWCHPTVSSSVVPFSFCLQSFQASGSFLMSRLFTSGSQTIRASVSASVLPMNIKGWFPFGFTGLISLQSKRRSRGFSPDLGKDFFAGSVYINKCAQRPDFLNFSTISFLKVSLQNLLGSSALTAAALLTTALWAPVETTASRLPISWLNPEVLRTSAQGKVPQVSHKRKAGEPKVNEQMDNHCLNKVYLKIELAKQG